MQLGFAAFFCLQVEAPRIMPPLDIYGNQFLLTSEVTVKAMYDAYKLQLASKATEVAENNPLGNYECFLQNAVPVIYNQNPSEECELCKPKRFYGFLCEHQVPNISLAAIWKWYDRHISHRLEVRLKDSRNNENKFHFVPKLSAVQLFGQPPLSNSNPETKTWEFVKVGSIVCPLSNSKTETSAAAVNLVEEESTVFPLSNANPETSAAPVNQVEEGCPVCSLSNSNPETRTGKFIKLGSFICLLSKTNSESSAAAVNLVEVGSTVCPLSNAKSETSAAAVNHVEEGSTLCPLSNADPETSAVAVNQVEGSTVCPLSNANPEKSAAPVNSIKTGSILFPEPYCSANNPEVIFEFLESEQLQQRKPFLKKIEELFEVGSSNHPMYGDPQKLYSSLHDIHPASWFSVAWYPEGDFNASFLTYHSLGHLVEKLITPIDLLKKEETSVIAYPVLGLASHNAQGEGWFELRIPGEAPEAENHVFDRNFTLAERVRSLEENASRFSRGCVCIRNSVVFNQHPDYELFISQQH